MADSTATETDVLSAENEHVVEPRHTLHREQTTFSEYLESLLVTVILALFGTSFVVQAFKIPSPSMEKTLLVGDHLLVNKFVPLGLTLLGPVIVNIFLYHALMDPKGLPLAMIAAVLWAIVFWYHKKAFAGILSA